MRSIRNILFVVCALNAIGAERAAGKDATNALVVLTPSYITTLGEELRTNNLALRAAAARRRAAEAHVGSVRTWENPTLRVGAMGASEMMRATDGDLIYGAEQRLPVFGKPEMARRVARAERATQSATEDYQFQRMRLEMARALFRAALAEETVEIGSQDIVWVETMVSTAEAKYGADQARLNEILQLQNELAIRIAGLATGIDQARISKLNLNRLLGRALEAPWPRLRLPAPAAEIKSSPRLLEFALKYEPQLAVRRRELAQAEAAAKLTGRERLPELSLGAEARSYSGDGEFRQGMVFMSMSIPWFNRATYHNATARDEERANAARLTLADSELTAQEEVHELIARIAAARRQAVLYGDEIVPRERAALRSTQTGWTVKRDRLEDVLEARRRLLESRLRRARYVAEQYEMLSELVLCCGLGDLTALEMLTGNRPEKIKETK